MFAAVTKTQWKWTRAVVTLTTLIGFAIPLGSLETARNAYSPSDFIIRMQTWGAGYALLAAGTGLLVALAAWSHDHRGRHVYALSLPVSRARYALLRFGAGAIFLIPPVIAVLISASMVSMSSAIPNGLHAYPLALTLRFAFAAGVAYAVFFAISSATPKAAGMVLGAIAALFLAQFLVGLVSSKADLIGTVSNWVFVEPGVLSVFAGRWMLIDV
jgi:hypothetical protein